MVFVVAPEEESGVKELLAAQGETVYCIGEVQSRNGDEPQVEILGLDTWASAPSAAVNTIGLRSPADESKIAEQHSAKLCMTGCALPETANKLYSGKVRDVYETADGSKLCLVATDRQSAFDRILAAVPFKGQVLNQVSEWWFKESAHIVPNHLSGDSPDPSVVLAKKCTPFAVEFVCRGYMTGSTDTSIWTHYKNGSRTYCGHVLPDGMQKNEKLHANLLTPTTKGEHDRPVSAEEVYSELGLMSKADWDYVAEKSLALFEFGQKTAAKRGLILVDTKYEFGKTEDGTIVLIDEVHTPDSSRFWIADSYAERFAAGKQPQNIDKEFLRLWYRDRCDPCATPPLPPRRCAQWSLVADRTFSRGYKDEKLPEAPMELVAELSRRYA